MPGMMSKKEAAAFEKVMKQWIDGLVVFQETGERKQFVATQDQLESFQKEFGTKVQITIE